MRRLIYPVPDPRYPFLGVHLTPRVDGTSDLGPNAVLALAREGYRRTDVTWDEVSRLARSAAFRRLARQHWMTGVREYRGSLVRRAYLAEARTYLPWLTPGDVTSAPAGVRAQAVDPDGGLVDDFRISQVGPVTVGPQRPITSGNGVDGHRRAHHRRTQAPARHRKVVISVFIVDSQVHIWKEETPDRPWIQGARERMRLNGHREAAFTYQECVALMDEAGVDRALILPPSWEGDRIDYALEACEAHPDRFGVMARVPQNKPAEGAAMMRDFAQNPYIKGTRLTFHRPIDRNWMIDGTNDWYWPLAEELGLVTMVHAPIWKAELGAIADRHPGLKIIIDHMGIMARCVDDAIGYWTAETADLYERPEHLRQGVGHPRLLDPPVPEPEHRQVRPRDGGQDGARALLLGHRPDPADGARPHLHRHHRAVHQALPVHRGGA